MDLPFGILRYACFKISRFVQNWPEFTRWKLEPEMILVSIIFVQQVTAVKGISKVISPYSEVHPVKQTWNSDLENFSICSIFFRMKYLTCGHYWTCAAL